MQSKAVDQWTRELPVAATRGIIVDRNGVILADNSESYAVYVRCRLLGDVKRTAEILAETLDMDAVALENKIHTHATSEITIKKRVDKASIAKLEEYNLPGVYFTTDVRFSVILLLTEQDRRGWNFVTTNILKVITGKFFMRQILPA